MLLLNEIVRLPYYSLACEALKYKWLSKHNFNLGLIYRTYPSAIV